MVTWVDIRKLSFPLHRNPIALQGAQIDCWKHVTNGAGRRRVDACHQRRRRRQHQRLAELDNLRDAAIVDHLETHHFSDARVGPYFARAVDQMVNPLESNLENIVFLVIGDTQKRQPFRLDLIAEVEGRDFYLGPRAKEALRQPIEECPPIRLVDLLSAIDPLQYWLRAQVARAPTMIRTGMPRLDGHQLPGSSYTAQRFLTGVKVTARRHLHILSIASAGARHVPNPGAGRQRLVSSSLREV